jgi:3-isopropylmalate/(R)-2-methylmalate dehydratase small subunit
LIKAGDHLRLDAIMGQIENLTTGQTIACRPIPAHLMTMVSDGGLIAHLQKQKIEMSNPS